MAPEKIGRYQIAGELGRGGMAVVYRGIDPVIKRSAAVKIIRKADLVPDDAASILDRFKREAQAAGSLQHPNIVGIYEYGEDEECAWIVMELVEGQSLRDHLLDGWRPDLSKLPAILEQLLEALDYSHAHGVVHRDVKPANVLISNMGVAKISDFGIARIERSHLTQAGELLGTPFYMAPEQYEGQDIDERTDIYSAGVIVYEVLCGRRPFDGQGGNLMRQILLDPPAPASTYEPRLPITIDMVLARAMAKKPQNRYRGAAEFLDALRQAFPGEAPAAKSGPGKAALAGKAGALRRALGTAASLAPANAAGATRGEGITPGTAGTPAKAIQRRPAVLFVDDEERVLNALTYLFRDIYEVETADGGAAALERLKTKRFHVLVSDQRMPEMVGVELLRLAKGVAPGTVRLLLTGYSDLAAIVGSVNESEVFRFVSKPWQEEDLLATLAEAIDVAIALEAATAAGPAPALPANTAVLVIGDAAVGRGAREMAKGGFVVHDAATTDDALEVLAAEDIAAIVCDLDGTGDAAALLRLLKEQSPQTQLIAFSAAADSELIIGMINEARIFRFLRKPVNFSLLHAALTAALKRNARLARSPGMVRAESARKTRTTGQKAAEQSLLGRLKSLGGRFAAALRN